jgi:murein DD-endopeptidase MepM/ murein hydrolase activator NlpD
MNLERRSSASSEELSQNAAEGLGKPAQSEYQVSVPRWNGEAPEYKRYGQASRLDTQIRKKGKPRKYSSAFSHSIRPTGGRFTERKLFQLKNQKVDVIILQWSGY